MEKKERTPEQIERRRAALRKYAQSDKFKAAQWKYRQTEKGKKTHRGTVVRYTQRNLEKVLAKQRKYNRERYAQSEELRVRLKRYRHSAAFLVSKRKYLSSQKGKDGQADQQLRWNYGITLNQYRELVLQQEGRCKICNSISVPDRSGRVPLFVDHDHRTGRVRGLLCHACNVGMYLIDSNKEAALRYADPTNWPVFPEST